MPMTTSVRFYLVYRKGSRMQTLRASSPGALTNLTGTAVGVDWPAAFLMWIVTYQYVNLFLVLWTILVPEASRGIIGFVERDLGVSPSLIATLFLFSVGITWRGFQPRWWLLMALIGQGSIALIALMYTVRSDITFTQFAGHGGLFMLSTLGIISMIPLSLEKKSLPNRIILASKHLLIPTIGVSLLLYGIGLAARPEAGVSLFIQSQFGPPLVYMLVVAFCVSAGCVVQNHISASRLFVGLIPQAVYAVMAIALLGADISVSLIGVFVHLEFLVTALFVVVIHTKEYARMLRLRARREA